MNTLTIPLSSSNTNIIESLSDYDLIDVTTLTIDLSNIYNDILPIFIIIDWGDGVTETIDNNLFKLLDFENINIFNPNPVLTTPYLHEYRPSGRALYTIYTLQVLIYYSNSEYSLFTVQLNLITNDYHESIEDLTLIGVNLLPESGNPKEYQLKAIKDNQLIELRDRY